MAKIGDTFFALSQQDDAAGHIPDQDSISRDEFDWLDDHLARIEQQDGSTDHILNQDFDVHTSIRPLDNVVDAPTHQDNASDYRPDQGHITNASVGASNDTVNAPRQQDTETDHLSSWDFDIHTPSGPQGDTPDDEPEPELTSGSDYNSFDEADNAPKQQDDEGDTSDHLSEGDTDNNSGPETPENGALLPYVPTQFPLDNSTSHSAVTVWQHQSALQGSGSRVDNNVMVSTSVLDQSYGGQPYSSYDHSLSTTSYPQDQTEVTLPFSNANQHGQVGVMATMQHLSNMEAGHGRLSLPQFTFGPGNHVNTWGHHGGASNVGINAPSGVFLSQPSFQQPPFLPFHAPQQHYPQQQTYGLIIPPATQQDFKVLDMGPGSSHVEGHWSPSHAVSLPGHGPPGSSTSDHHSTSHVPAAVRVHPSLPGTNRSPVAWPPGVFPYEFRDPTDEFWPPAANDFKRQNEERDGDFYGHVRIEWHWHFRSIVDVQQYFGSELFDQALPCTPHRRILDLGASWYTILPENSHGPSHGTAMAQGRDPPGFRGLEIVGIGMNWTELEKNRDLSIRHMQDLNEYCCIPNHLGMYQACIIANTLEFFTNPQMALASVYDRLHLMGRVHVIVGGLGGHMAKAPGDAQEYGSLTEKVTSWWLRASSEQRLQRVVNFLHHANFRRVKLVTLYDPSAYQQQLSNGQMEPSWRQTYVPPRQRHWIVTGTKCPSPPTAMQGSHA